MQAETSRNIPWSMERDGIEAMKLSRKSSIKDSS
jgi:hypothetical protein